MLYLNSVFPLALEVLTHCSFTILNLSEICICQSPFHEPPWKLNTIAEHFCKSNRVKQELCKWQKALKMAMVKDLMRVHYNVVDEEIGIFLWHTYFQIITKTVIDNIILGHRFPGISHNFWNTYYIYLYKYIIEKA